MHVGLDMERQKKVAVLKPKHLRLSNRFPADHAMVTGFNAKSHSSPRNSLGRHG
jgi:hypothetical protein